MEQSFAGRESNLMRRSAGEIQLHELLTATSEKDASDLHLKVGSPPVMRINGELVVQSDFEALSPSDLQRLFEQVANPKQRERFERTRELDLSYGLSGIGRFRVNIGSQRGTLTMVVRRLSSQIPSIDELGLPPICKELVMEPSGLVLVTGPTSSGKSTTLAAMISHINAQEARRVVTIEDPIEYLFRDNRCFITQRELGDDTLGFAEGLKHALRQDPDVILVGELRDPDTISAALTAAETGHLVLSALHATSATLALDRIQDMFPLSQQQQVRAQLAHAVVGILSQALVPTADGRGRVAAIEVMTGSPAIKALIREGRTQQISGVIETSQRLGMQTLDQALLSLYERGKINLDDVLLKAQNRDFVRARLQSIAKG